MTKTEADAVIVGGSHAGSELAFRLRHGGFAGRIALLSAEAHLPYQRPPLSKAFLAGETSVEQLLIRDPESYAKNDIAWHPSTTVTAIDRGTRKLRLADGTEFGYEKLVLATGGRPRVLPLPGAALKGIFTMRAIPDVDSLRPYLVSGKKLVIVGGGYIGLEVAAVAVKRGLNVEIVEFAPRVLQRVAGPKLSAFYDAAHRAAGVRLRLNTGVDGFGPAEGDPTHVGAVHCSDGTILPADLVLVAAGLVPNMELAQAAGLAVANGVVVDEFCQTSDPDILAIGDCAEFPHPVNGRRIRLESVPNAVEQARVAASVLNGAPKAYGAVPWFWSDQYDLKLQSVGLNHGYEEEIVRPALSPDGFVVFYVKGGRVLAADCVNAVREFNWTKRLVADQTVVDPAALADPAVDLKSLMLAKAG
jgi:3-phenylpropionate/trans-cinnamate dioxygenase ferredoxin reductase subunit